MGPRLRGDDDLTHPWPADGLSALERKMPPSFESMAKPNPALNRYRQTFKPANR